MDDALLMRRLERVGDLARDRERLLNGSGARRQTLGQRRAFHELEHEAAHAVGLFQSVDRADVRMIERREHARLALEARQPVGV